MIRNGLVVLAVSGVVVCSSLVGVAQVPRQGVTVHGHWVMSVHNPDGTLVTRREFDNDLSPMAEAILALALNGETPIGSWAILLEGTPFDPDPSANYLSSLDGFIVENRVPASITQGTGASRSLVRLQISNESVPNRHPFGLWGSATAVRDGDVVQVSTQVLHCRTGAVTNYDPVCECYRVYDPPAELGCGWPEGEALAFRRQLFRPFSGTAIAPLHLDRGQILKVTVEIGFQ